MKPRLTTYGMIVYLCRVGFLVLIGVLLVLQTYYTRNSLLSPDTTNYGAQLLVSPRNTSIRTNFCDIGFVVTSRNETLLHYAQKSWIQHLCHNDTSLTPYYYPYTLGHPLKLYKQRNWEIKSECRSGCCEIIDLIQRSRLDKQWYVKVGRIT